MRLSSHDKKDYLVFRHGNLVFKFMHVSRRVVDGHIVAQQTPASRQRSSVHPPPTGPEPRELVNGPSRPAPGATSGRTLVVGSSSPAPSRTHARRRRVQFASSDVVRHGPPERRARDGVLLRDASRVPRAQRHAGIAEGGGKRAPRDPRASEGDQLRVQARQSCGLAAPDGQERGASPSPSVSSPPRSVPSSSLRARPSRR